MRLDLRPTLLKLTLPVLLVLIAFLPPDGLVFLAHNLLYLPFTPLYLPPPFVYRDKPWYVAPAGALLASVVWGVLLYLVMSLRRKQRL